MVYTRLYPVLNFFFIGVGGELMHPYILRFPTLFVPNIKDNNFIWKERLFYNELIEFC